VKEIPEDVSPMRRDIKTEYGILLLELGDEANAKKMLDMAIKDNMQFAKYFARWEEDYEWAARELGNSRYLNKRIIDFLTQKGKTDWAGKYKQQTQGY
jgi:hypothetical protein